MGGILGILGACCVCAGGFGVCAWVCLGVGGFGDLGLRVLVILVCC